MEPFWRYVTATVRSSPLLSIGGVLLQALGISVSELEQHFLSSPPAILAQWWMPYVVALFGLWLTAYAFYRQSEARRQSGPQPDWSGKDAIRHVWLRSKWSFQTTVDTDGRRMIQAINVMRDAARQQRIKIWGRLASDSFPGAELPAVLEPIAPEYWKRASFDLTTLISEDGITLATEPLNVHTPTYDDLWFNRGEVLALWKAANMFRLWQRKRQQTTP
jgi:hypothetical protein